MRFPLVTRAHYEAVVAMQAQTIEHQRIQYASLEARYHMLRLQGYTEHHPIPVPVVSPVDAAIARVAGADHRKAEMMRKAVARDRAEGLSDQTIVQRIYAGTPTDDRAEL